MIALLPFLVAAAAQTATVDVDEYSPSPLQTRVDRSFSAIPIASPFSLVRPRLTEVQIQGCEKNGECEWRDRDGVRYYFWGDPESLGVVVKDVWAGDFKNRRIPAMEIGLARRRGAVMAAARHFAPEATFECSRLAEPWLGEESCEAFLRPGWVTIVFDKSGNLTEVRLDGYHFT